MELKITRLDETLPLPKYESAGACAFDVMSSKDMTIPPGELALIPTGIVVHVPEGHVLMLASRSSTPRKKGLLTPHGFGTIDQDYCGPNDELQVQVLNFTDKDAVISHGDRVAQALIVPIARCNIIEGPATAPDRGGFGTTG